MLDPTHKDDFEPLTRRLWREKAADCAANNQIVLDVGAFTGVYAIEAAKQGAKAYAIEPCAAPYRLLLEHIKGHAVTPMNIAVSDYDGDGVMHGIRPDGCLSSAASLDKDARPEPKTTHDECIVRRIDSLFKDIGLVKIDAEGVEASVMRGMSKLKSRPFVIVEIWPKHKKEFEAEFGALQHIEGDNYALV